MFISILSNCVSNPFGVTTVQLPRLSLFSPIVFPILLEFQQFNCHVYLYSLQLCFQSFWTNNSSTATFMSILSNCVSNPFGVTTVQLPRLSLFSPIVFPILLEYQQFNCHVYPYSLQLCFQSFGSNNSSTDTFIPILSNCVPNPFGITTIQLKS